MTKKILSYFIIFFIIVTLLPLTGCGAIKNILGASEDTEQYTFKCYRVKANRSYYFTFEENQNFWATAYKVLVSNTGKEIKSEVSCHVIGDSTIDTSIKGKQTFTVKVDEDEKEYNVTIQVMDFKLDDGVYAQYSPTSDIFESIKFKVNDGIISRFDYKNNKYVSFEEDKPYIYPLVEARTYTDNVLTIYKNACMLSFGDSYNADLEISFIVNNGKVKIIDNYSVYSEDQLVFLTSYKDPIINSYFIKRLDYANTIYYHQIDDLKTLGIVSLEENGPELESKNFKYTGNRLYIR